jgi:ABC-type multidrug transport system fused ATPase/permease subunit
MLISGRTLLYLLGVFTTVFTVSSVAPMFLIAFFVLAISYYRYAVIYQNCARELRRLDSVSKSPVYSIYGEAIAGAAIIRGFGASSRSIGTMLQRVTVNVSFYYWLWSSKYFYNSFLARYSCGLDHSRYQPTVGYPSVSRCSAPYLLDWWGFSFSKLPTG